MDLVFCTEGRFIRRSDNSVYSLDGSLTNKLWERYLASFDRIFVMARVLTDDHLEIRDIYLASSERVVFIDLPYYIGPFQYVKVYFKLKNIISRHIKPGRAYICRVPGQIGNSVAKILWKKRISYGVEVVGDPWDVFAPGASRHFLRIFFRYHSRYFLKKVVKRSVAALYVTDKTLQSRYPVRSGVFQVSASDVQINTNQLPSVAKKFHHHNVYNLISVGSLEQMYKAPDVVLHAVKKLKDRGVICNLTWLGDGVYKSEMQNLADCLGIQDQVHFIGNIPSEGVVQQLLKSDIFILVSRTEGLPRALIEAMSIGLPCIGTQVGGIPELLEETVLIPKDDIDALVNKIEYMTRNACFTSDQATLNYEKSKNYYGPVLNARRESLYNELISLSMN